MTMAVQLSLRSYIPYCSLPCLVVDLLLRRADQKRITSTITHPQ